MSKISDLIAAINRLAAAIENANRQSARTSTVLAAIANERAGLFGAQPAPGASKCWECGVNATVRADHAPGCSVRNPHPAQLMPQPKGRICAAGCGHDTGSHREGGCDVAVSNHGDVCPCPAPFGRIMPPPAVPDDPSSLLGGAS